MNTERLGYPTQKPLGLLRRIIEASSNPGDMVLDPFCGCGTAIDAAQELGRKWIGIDLTHLAVTAIKSRVFGRYGLKPRVDYRVVGEPQDIGSARELAADTEQFEYWALGLIGARPWEGKQQKGADKGRDGVLIFQDDMSGRVRRAVVSVKSGKHISSRDIRDLRGTVERDKTELGIFLTLEPPTKEMLNEAAAAGAYTVPFTGEQVPRIQIFTIADLLADKTVDLPKAGTISTLKQAQRAKTPPPTQFVLGENPPPTLPDAGGER